MKQFILITGGARSGKSSYAERQAAELGEDVLYVASAQAFDDEMRLRIRNHQNDRPDHWHTIESPTGVGEAIMTSGLTPEVVLLDCVTLLATNVMLSLPEPWSSAEIDLNREIDALWESYQQGNATYLIVTNEVGFGIVPANKMSRVYRDLLGRANQRLATLADHVYLLVAGLPLAVK
ncbi:MAG: bifunctional adenosylcobinamide kinase/adenosylcobinamide-phosphate guanylyltransferase [Candidatus Promineifilaceae bacterium]